MHMHGNDILISNRQLAFQKTIEATYTIFSYWLSNDPLSH